MLLRPPHGILWCEEQIPPQTALRCPPLPPTIPLPTRAVARSPAVGSCGGSRTLRLWRSTPPPAALPCELRDHQSFAPVEDICLRPPGWREPAPVPVSRGQRFRVTAGAALRRRLLAVTGLLVELRGSSSLPLRLRRLWHIFVLPPPRLDDPRTSLGGLNRPPLVLACRAFARPLPVRPAACTERGPSARSQPRRDGTCTALLSSVVSA